MDSIIDFANALSSNAGGLIDDLIAFIKSIFGAVGDLAGSSKDVVPEDPTSVPLVPLEPATPIDPEVPGQEPIPGAATNAEDPRLN